MHMVTLHNPNAYSFLSPGIHITCVFNCHLGIGSVETSHMLVVETLLAPYEYFPERPILFHVFDSCCNPPALGCFVRFCFSLFCVCSRRFSHPGAFFMCLHSRF